MINLSGLNIRIILRYILFHLPPLLLIFLLLLLIHSILIFPVWIAWAAIVFWIAKDVGMFFISWRSYDPNRIVDETAMIGKRGIAIDRLDPSGYVRINEELWQAEISSGTFPIEQNESIIVIGMKGIILVVKSLGVKVTVTRD